MKYNNSIIIPGGRKVASQEPIDDRLIAENLDTILQSIGLSEPLMWYPSMPVYVDSENSDYVWLQVDLLPPTVDESTKLLPSNYQYPANHPDYPEKEFNFFAKAGQGGATPGVGDMEKSNYATRSNEIVDTAFAALGVDWSGVGNKPDFDATYAPKLHQHAINDVDNLQEILNNKFGVSNLPTIAQVQGLVAELDNRLPTDDTKTDALHTWSALKILDAIGNAGGGDMLASVYAAGQPAGRVSEAAVALAVAWDNITGKPTYFPVDPNSTQLDNRYYTQAAAQAAFAPENHDHVVDDINGLLELIQAFASYEVKKDDFTAVNGKGYIVLATNNTINITLPSNIDGSRIDVLPLDLTNAVTLTPTSGQIGGGAAYAVNTINSVYQPFYSTDLGEWKVLTEQGGTGGIGDAPDGEPHFRVQNNWVKSQMILRQLALDNGISKGYVWNPTLNGGLGGFEEQAATQDAVTSVNGEVGTVVLDTSNINDGLNKRYVTDAEKAAITSNAQALAGKADIIFPDPAVTQHTIAPVTQAWLEVQDPANLDENTQYVEVDNGNLKIVDTSGATRVLLDTDQNKILFSTNNFTLPAGIVGRDGWSVRLTNKSSTTAIELDITAVSFINVSGTAINIPAGESILVVKLNTGDNYMKS